MQNSTFFWFALLTLAFIDSAPAQTSLGRPAASTSSQTAPVSPPAQSLEDWRTHMATVPPPSKGCFAVSYPSTEWHEVPCGPAPHRRYQPQRANP